MKYKWFYSARLFYDDDLGKPPVFMDGTLVSEKYALNFDTAREVILEIARENGENAGNVRTVIVACLARLD